MPILDDAAANNHLASHYGSGRAAGAPDAWDMELWDGDPTLETSAELSGNGYAAASVDSDDFSTPSDRKTTVQGTFPAPSGAWETATHWLLRDPVTGYGGAFGILADPLDVTSAGDAPIVLAVVFYDNPQED